ncbi:MAG: hypothetical protein ACRDTU_09520 [Micromonosporaceae bacterium]
MTRPEGRAEVGDPYLLRGLLVCARCGQLVVPVYREGRAYSCGPSCRQPDVPAVDAEADMLLGALIRGAVSRDPELGRTALGDPSGPVWWSGECRPAVSSEEMNRWRRCDMRDRRAVILAAYSRVVVNLAGRLRPVWRHRSGEAPPPRGGV